jgi:pimeloyl-ACP methyl ester carboxylesterase
MTAIKYRSVDVDGVKIFYREAGAADGPALLLLHGFPSASHMFRELIPLLAGLSEAWHPIRAYWQEPSQANREALRAFLAPEATRWQYTHGVTDEAAVSPDGLSLDNFYLARPGADEVQLDLFGDYKSNVALYPIFQHYFRTHRPPFLAVWGKNDPFFLPPGAEAFKRDIPGAAVRFFDTGHFALETHAAEIAAAIRDFLTP